MKAFIVFAAVIAVAAANAVGRVSGNGWGAAVPQIDLELSAAAAAAASGAASGAQALIEQVSGNAADPASLSSVNGVAVGVSQGEDITQVAIADLTNGSTSTINGVDVGNDASAVDILEASLSGANGAAVTNTANTDASGEGAIAADASSLNVVQLPGQGWRQ